MKGFYIPGSRSGSYVASKRTEDGGYLYDTAGAELGMQRQAALQNLSENYATTVENAYASYLANQRGIQASQMGQGYKEAYEKSQREQLTKNIAESTLNAQRARAELEQQSSEARTSLEETYKTEVANLDKVATSFDDYLSYVKSLTSADDSGATYFTEEEASKSVDDLYEQLYTAQPQSLFDEEGNAGLPYLQWMKSKLSTDEKEAAWLQWLMYGGGLQDFMQSVNARRK